MLAFDYFFGVPKVLVDNAAESVKVEAWCRQDIKSKTMLTQLDVKIWNMCCENLPWEHPESECLYLRDQTWCVCIGLRPRDRPVRWDKHPREFDTNNTHIIMFGPDYNMMTRFFSTATNILLIKNNLNFESRATAVFVAMSPRYLGGKYRSRLHPRSQKCVCLFCGRLSVWNRTALDRRHLLPVATTKLIMRCV